MYGHAGGIQSGMNKPKKMGVSALKIYFRKVAFVTGFLFCQLPAQAYAFCRCSAMVSSSPVTLSVPSGIRSCPAPHPLRYLYFKPGPFSWFPGLADSDAGYTENLPGKEETHTGIFPKAIFEDLLLFFNRDS